jgi:hydrogenase 3 maturation protease
MAAHKRLERRLRRSLKGKVLLIGAGNELRSDDGAGAVLARRLENRLRASVLDAGSALESFLSPVLREAPDTVALIDAVHFDGRPGEVGIFHAADLGLARLGTHGMSPGLFMKTLEQQGVARTLLIGIQPGTTAVGQEMTAEVQAAVETLDTVLTRILGMNG